MTRTVLVTGGAGYIGSHTCIELLDNGDDVVIVDNLDNSSRAAVAAIQQIAGRSVEFVEGDVTDAATVDAVLGSHPIDAVIHFAALKAVGESTERPLDYYRNNLVSTLVLVEAMARHGVNDLVFSSSCTVYGDPAQVPVTESSPRSGVNPYGRTKLFNEDLLIDLAAADDRWRISLLRYFNPVGAHASGEIGEDPRGIPNNLMPFIMQVAVGRRDQLSVFGSDYPTRDGTCIRDYIHVVDLAQGHLAALDALDRTGAGCKAYNLGTGTGSTVLEVIDAAGAAVGSPIPYTIVDRRPGDAAAVFADPTHANEALGWRAERDLATMCADHWRWQSTHPEGFGSN